MKGDLIEKFWRNSLKGMHRFAGALNADPVLNVRRDRVVCPRLGELHIRCERLITNLALFWMWILNALMGH